MIIPVLKCYLNTTQKGIEHGLLLIINSLVYKALLAAHTINQLIIDATERRIERPKDKEANTAQYSGKKNTIL